MSMINDPDFVVAMMRKELLYNCDDKLTQNLVCQSLKSYLETHAETSNLYLLPIIPTIQESVHTFESESPPIVFPEDSINSFTLRPSEINAGKHPASVSAASTVALEGLRESNSNFFLNQDEENEIAAEVEEKIQEDSDKALKSNQPVDFLTIEKFPKGFPVRNAKETGVSILGQMINKKNLSTNPFADSYSVFSGKGGSNRDSMKIKIWLPFCTSSQKPLDIVVKKTASVEEVIGFVLYEYVEAGRSPLPATDVSVYSLMIVEDDGEVDDDLPALDRQRKIQKFSFDKFAVCVDSDALKKWREQNVNTLTETENGGGGKQFYIRVHVYSTLEVKQTTTISVEAGMKLSEVLEIVCRKRKVEVNDYTLKLPDTKADLSLNLTIGQLNVTELWMQRKDRGISAGDIFLRPADERNSDSSRESSPTAYFNADDSLNTYKRYVVTRKTQLFGGKQDRILTIDGEFIQISPSTDNKNFFDSVKTTSYHIATIVSCVQVNKTSPNFRLICLKDRETSKTYEFEAQSLAECNGEVSPPRKKRAMAKDEEFEAETGETSVINGSSSGKNIAYSKTKGCVVSANNAITPDVVNREEMVRIVSKWLWEKGYRESCALLQEESDVPMESQVVRDFQSSVLRGNWENAIELIPSMSNGEDGVYNKICVLIKTQEFLELLESKDMAAALNVLRNQISPLLEGDVMAVKKLSSFMMLTNADTLRKVSEWEGSGPASRGKLLSNLQKYLRSDFMIPEARLDQLMLQALEHQTSKCLYHNIDEKVFSLYKDHCCDSKEIFPSGVVATFDEHGDEVWFVQFSPCGQYLASSSKDSFVYIFDIENKCLHKTLSGHTDSVSFLAWRPDSEYILSCGNDSKLKLWKITSGSCERTFSKHSAAVTSCAWFPDGKKLISAGIDQCINMWRFDGVFLHRWNGIRVNDVGITPDGNTILAVCQEKKIKAFDVNSKAELWNIPETDPITSLVISKDGDLAMLNLSSQEIHVWDIKTQCLVNKFVGHKQGRFVIRSAFGGTNDAFIISGSEDSKVYVWNRQHAKLVESFSGHSATVNSVSWNPKNPRMFASASDDGSVKLWL